VKIDDSSHGNRRAVDEIQRGVISNQLPLGL